MSYFVEAEDIVFSYGNKIVIEKSSFKIPFNGLTAIIGPNGSGKSTILNSIANIIEPTAGKIHICGGKASCSWQHVSYVMQSLDFPKGTPIKVKEIVGMGLYTEIGLFRRKTWKHKEIIEAAMEKMQIQSIANSHLSELSGGQRQRVFIAQGLVQPHKALMLDEPMTGLDLVSSKIIDDIIHEKQHEEGSSVILTTHDLGEAAVADHVILMGGKVVASGTPEKVLTQRNLEEAYGLGQLHQTNLPIFK